MTGAYRPTDEASRIDHDPFEYDPDERDRQTLAHAKLQNKVAQLASDAGYEVHQPGIGDPVKFDIAWNPLLGGMLISQVWVR